MKVWLSDHKLLNHQRLSKVREQSHVVLVQDFLAADIVICESLDSADLIEQLFSKGSLIVKPILQLESTFFEDDFSLCQYLLLRPPKRDFAWLQTILGRMIGSELQDGFSLDQFKDYAQKMMLYDDYLATLSEHQAASWIQQNFRAGWAEIAMNALYDAPQLSHRGKLGQSEPAVVHSALVSTNRSVLFGCIDTYGSLDLKIWFSRLRQLHQEGTGQSIRMNGDQGGAGIGCQIILEAVSSLVMIVINNKYSLVFGRVDHTKRFKSFSMKPKNVIALNVAEEI